MPNKYRPEADVQLIPYFEYDPSIHQIEYRYAPNTSGETYTTFNPTSGATDYRFFPVPRPFYPYPRPPFYGGYPYGGYHPYPYSGYGGYHGYPHGGYPSGYHGGSPSR